MALIREYLCQDDAPNGVVEDTAGLNDASLQGVNTEDVSDVGPGGLLAKSFLFNGLLLEYPGEFTLVSPFTICFFAKRNTTSAPDHGIFQRDGGEDTLYFLGGTDSFRFADSGSTLATKATGVDTTDWHHYAITYVAGEAPVLYVDGASIGVFDTVCNGSFVGLYTGNQLDGYLAGIKLYDEVRSSSEILADAREGYLGTPTPGYATHSIVTNPSSSLTDFTFLISLDEMPASWWLNVKSDGGDIRVYKTDGTRLPIDVIRIDLATSSGLLAAKWTGARSTGNTQKIEIWVGDAAASQPAAGDTYGQYNAYDASWRGFWPSGLGNDRTSFLNNLTPVGSPTVGGAAGPINGSLATDLNGSGQYGTATASVPTAPPYTFLASGSSDDATVNQYAVSVTDTALTADVEGLGWRGAVGGDPIALVAVQLPNPTITANSATGYSAATYHRGAAVSVSTSSRFGGIDGVLGSEVTTAITPAGIDKIGVGALVRLSVQLHFNGRLSLVQLHTAARHVDWVAYDADMLSANDPDQSEFYGVWEWVSGNAGLLGCGYPVLSIGMAG